MKKCEYCGNPIVGKKKTARFCCDFCRLKAFRGKNGSKYQSRGDGALNVPENKFSGFFGDNARALAFPVCPLNVPMSFKV